MNISLRSDGTSVFACRPVSEMARGNGLQLRT